MTIRPSPIAGSWYPGEARQLTGQLDRYLAQAEVDEPAGRIWGIVAPHAGYLYSGSVAAYAFKSVQGYRPDLVVVLSPLHHPHHADLLTTAHEAYETPLGLIPVDHEAVERLNRMLEAGLSTSLFPLRYDQEHSLEIELPFLQHVLPEPFQLLPIMIRDQRLGVVEQLGRALATLLQGRNVLLVASSDLSHFYPQTEARKLDQEFLRRLERFDPRSVATVEEDGVAYACGRGAVAAVLWAAAGLGANRVKVLRYATSGDVSGDFQRVVGYGAALIWEEEDHHCE